MKIIHTLINVRSDKRYGFESLAGKLLILLLIAFGLSMVIISVYSVPTYANLIKEDGIVETASAILWLMAAITVTLTLYFGKTIKKKSFLLSYFFLLTFFITCGGEEISWGQRLFHFQDISIITSINKQQETNLHDIGSISVFANAFFLLYLAFFFFYHLYFDCSLY